jgi:predicted RNA methylase
MATRQHLYGDPEIYDILHDDNSAADVKTFARIAARCSAKIAQMVRERKPLTWLEPASGSGRYLLACAARGDTAIGVDMSRDMISYSLVRAKSAKLESRVGGIVAKIESFSLADAIWADTVKKNSAKQLLADIAFNPINSIRHLGSDAAMVKHFACVARAMKPGGVYVVGLSLSAYGLESASEDVWVGKRDRISVTQVVQFEPVDVSARGVWKRRERVMSHLTITSTLGEEHRDSSYWLRTYNLREWLRVVDKAGWRVAGVFDNQGKQAVAHEPGYFLFALVSD